MSVMRSVVEFYGPVMTSGSFCSSIQQTALLSKGDLSTPSNFYTTKRVLGQRKENTALPVTAEKKAFLVAALTKVIQTCHVVHYSTRAHNNPEMWSHLQNYCHY